MSDQPTTPMTNELERLRADIATIRNDLRELLAATADVGRAGTTVAREKIKTGVVEVKHAASVARQKGEEAVEGVQHTIQERPLTSVLIAFGLGLLIARIMDRRS